MKKIVISLCLIILFAIFAITSNNQLVSFAQNNVPDINYVVCNEDDVVLFERISVVVGDVYIDKNFDKYEVYLVDEVTHTAKARFVEKLSKPKLTKKSMSDVNQDSVDKKIALYMTHNAESYITGDGTDSIYGAGGIHDVGKKLAYELRQKGINVFLDETLHIPHDVYAYNRSRTTAQKLLTNNVNAVFDIHRDGASRSTYAKVTNGVEHSTVRIVVGQANSKKDLNLQFALYLLSVAEIVCPWLFLDIFYAKGHYNQDLYEKSLLFEMGTYTIEKDLVLKTVPHLAEVINTTLFNTTVNEEGDLTIGNPQSNTDPTIDIILENNYGTNNTIKYFTSSIALIFVIGGIAFFIIKYRKRKLS